MILQLDSVCKQYVSSGQPVVALDGVSLELDGGRFVALRGLSGSGKSTLLLTAGGLMHPDHGTVRVAGHDLYSMSSDDRAGFRASHIGFVFQQFHLIPYLNVLDNVLTATLGGNGRHASDARDHARQLIARLNLEPRLRHRPSELSTGERQRTALARALMNRPRLLLADEPTGNLDDENSDIVLGYLCQFADDGGAVLLATHDADAAQVAQVSLRIEGGRFASALT